MSGRYIVEIRSDGTVYTAPSAGVSRLDLHDYAFADTLDYTVSSGSNRLLVVGVRTEGNLPTTFTYGTQDMNLEVSNTTSAIKVAIYTLDENGLQAATNSTISTSGGSYVMLFASSYEGVDQTTPVPESNNTDGTGTFLSISIAAGDGSAVYGISNCNSSPGITADWSNGDLTELDEYNDTGQGSAGSSADGLFATGQSVTVRCDWSQSNLQAIAGIEIAPAS